MNLLDKLKLALRAAVEDIVSEEPKAHAAKPGAAPSNEDTLRLIERAEAKLDILRADQARARKAGQTELATRLDQEIAGLQKTLDKTRQRIGKVNAREQQADAIERVQETRKEQRKATERADEALAAREERTAQREDKAAARDDLDNTRIADALKKDT
jgi:hypothetical protein